MYLVSTIFYYIIVFIFLTRFLNQFLHPRYRINFLKPKSLKLGSLRTLDITILEWKPIGSILLFYFCPGGEQGIYHTHSFESYSYLIFGNYIEKVIDLENETSWEMPRNRSRKIYIPKDRFHQITDSTGCMTLMFAGSWGDSFKEYDPETKEIIVRGYGRREISREKVNFNKS